MSSIQQSEASSDSTNEAKLPTTSSANTNTNTNKNTANKSTSRSDSRQRTSTPVTSNTNTVSPERSSVNSIPNPALASGSGPAIPPTQAAASGSASSSESTEPTANTSAVQATSAHSKERPTSAPSPSIFRHHSPITISRNHNIHSTGSNVHSNRTPNHKFLFPSTPQYDSEYLDHAPLSPFFRASPKVTPRQHPTARAERDRDPDRERERERDFSHPNSKWPPTPSRRNLPAPKYTMSMKEEDFRSDPDMTAASDAANPHSNPGASTHPENEGSSPLRVSKGKVTVVSPPEEGGRGVARTKDLEGDDRGYDIPSVPDSPYPSSSPVNAKGWNESQYQSRHGYGGRFMAPPHYYYEHGYYPPPGPEYDGKRQRTDDIPIPPPPPGPPGHFAHHPMYPPGHGPHAGHHPSHPPPASSSGGHPPPPHYAHYPGSHPSIKQEDEEERMKYHYPPSGPPPHGPPPRGPHYGPFPPPPGPGYYRPSVSESFESSSEAGSKRSSPRRPGAGSAAAANPSGPPAVQKAPSYPPPPSPRRYGAGADGSAASYPGARRNRGHGGPEGSDYSYSNPGIYHSPKAQSSPYMEHGGHPPHGTSSRYPYEEDYARERFGLAPSGPPPGSRNYEEENAEYYPYPSRDRDHPLLKEDPGGPVLSPPRRKSSAGAAEKESPNKPRPSTQAQAAIAAGMTEPPSAKEVDFDINNPPTKPVTPPSTIPVCSQSSDVNIHDVLCGRGGGTNTQIGNRRFRSLVQEFQPTYLLCRRKEKPLIARTIVLIIRNRGGRFLKKNEDDGTYFEVGDEKAEAKTSQALREGLDVRASRSTMDGKKKPRVRKKKPSPKKSPVRLVEEGHEESPRRDAPPPEYGHGHGHPYHPPPPYGHYDPFQPPYYPPPSHEAMYYPPHAHQYPYTSSPRKRPRGPPGEYEYHYSSSPYKPGSGAYPEHQYYSSGHPPMADARREEENPWETDFSPPRNVLKKHGDGH